MLLTRITGGKCDRSCGVLARSLAAAMAMLPSVLSSQAGLPPVPPLGPPPEPQPNCTACRWPKHSWATIPASVHTSRRDTGPDGTFTDADIANLVKYPLITIEKWQGVDAVDPATGKRAFIWEEDAWINSAKKIKAVNPAVSVVPWMDTMLVYTGWRLDGKEEKKGKPPPSEPVNHTLNADALYIAVYFRDMTEKTGPTQLVRTLCCVWSNRIHLR